MKVYVTRNSEVSVISLGVWQVFCDRALISRLYRNTRDIWFIFCKFKGRKLGGEERGGWGKMTLLVESLISSLLVFCSPCVSNLWFSTYVNIVSTSFMIALYQRVLNIFSHVFIFMLLLRNPLKLVSFLRAYIGKIKQTCMNIHVAFI